MEFHIEPDLLCKSGVNLIYLSDTIVEPIKSQFGIVMPDPINNHIYLVNRQLYNRQYYITSMQRILFYSIFKMYT